MPITLRVLARSFLLSEDDNAVITPAPITRPRHRCFLLISRLFRFQTLNTSNIKVSIYISNLYFYCKVVKFWLRLEQGSKILSWIMLTVWPRPKIMGEKYNIFIFRNSFGYAWASNMPTLFDRREELCKKYFTGLKRQDHKLHHLLPPSRNVPYPLRDAAPLVLPKIKTQRYFNSLVPCGIRNDTNA